MPTRPDAPDPTGANPTDPLNPFASMGSGMGAGLGFFQDWLKAAGSALPHLPGATAGANGAGMPAWSMPTLDPEELDKRIQDLKTVQFWLEQNARMIAMTIQGLEVQRMTLSTLQGMNVSMDHLRESLKARAATPAASAPAASTPPPAPPAPSPTPPPSRAAWGHSAPTPEHPGGSDDAPPTDATHTAEAAPDAAGLINPMRWWDTLTQQFTHLATQAAQTVGDSVEAATQAGATARPTATTKASSGKAGAKVARKASAKSASKSASKASPAAKTARKTTPRSAR